MTRLPTRLRGSLSVALFAASLAACGGNGTMCQNSMQTGNGHRFCQ